jgi:molybdenum ABC transporter molybdate-binding protein
MWHILFIAMAVAMALVNPAAKGAEPLRLHAAGSLKAALTDVAKAYEKNYGTAVATTFGPSGLLRQRIEKGEPAHVFASANMQHPQALMKDGRGGPVALFARNRLCALTQTAVDVAPETLLDRMLQDGVRLGASTPKADPAGDYAWELFAKADKIRPGAGGVLDKKALKLTGGPDSAKPPEGRNQYAWVMESGKADIFLTYCTNAVLAKKEVASLKIVPVPPGLSVGADYGLIVLKDMPAEAGRLALFILSPEGQAILAAYGFDAAAVPVES